KLGFRESEIVERSILSRLPAKSVGRFRSVSKLWSAITTSQDFINSFATRSLTSRPSVLITVRKGDMLFVFSSPLHKNSRLHNNNSDGPLSCLGSYQFSNSNFGNIRRYDYLHGLVFLEFSERLVIWNPTLKRFFTLPEPQGIPGKCDRGCIVLGYDSIEGKYMILRVLRDSTICILTVGAQGKGLCNCIIITNGVPWHRPTTRFGGCFKGVMYYAAAVYVGDGFEHNIMSFNVKSEKFNQIKYPEGNSLVSSHVVPYEGRLAIVKTINFPSIDLWILTNGDRHEWTHKRFVLPLSEMEPILSEKLCFYGVSYAGELIFTQRRLFGSFYILYFDPRRNSIREVSVEGIVRDEFRSRYGFDKDCMYNMEVYPNHIESLMFL
ncbi:F-box associated domain type 3, partial [Arabidopsis suecica]